MVNEEYINFVLDAVEAWPNEWSTAWSSVRVEHGRKVWRNPTLLENSIAISERWNDLFHICDSDGQEAVWDSIRALLEYKDSSLLFLSTVDEISILSRLGNRPAYLMEPAIIALDLIHKNSGIKILPKSLHKFLSK